MQYNRFASYVLTLFFIKKYHTKNLVLFEFEIRDEIKKLADDYNYILESKLRTLAKENRDSIEELHDQLEELLKEDDNDIRFSYYDYWDSEEPVNDLLEFLKKENNKGTDFTKYIEFYDKNFSYVDDVLTEKEKNNIKDYTFEDYIINIISVYELFQKIDISSETYKEEINEYFVTTCYRTRDFVNKHIKTLRSVITLEDYSYLENSCIAYPFSGRVPQLRYTLKADDYIYYVEQLNEHLEKEYVQYFLLRINRLYKKLKRTFKELKGNLSHKKFEVNRDKFTTRDYQVNLKHLKLACTNMLDKIGEVEQSTEDDKEFIKKSYPLFLKYSAIIEARIRKVNESGVGMIATTEGIEEADLSSVVNSEYFHSRFYDASRDNDIETMQYLIDKGIDVNGDFMTFTPLMYASQQGNIEAVKLLLENGAGPDIQNMHTGTAAILAKSNDQTEVLELLSEYEGGTNK